MSQEIERKWLLKRLPYEKPIRESSSLQAYLSVDPVVRIRTKFVEDPTEDDTRATVEPKHYLTIKGDGTIARTEVELRLTWGQHVDLLSMVPNRLTPIHKYNRYYSLDGRCDPSTLVDPDETLRVDVVDEGSINSFIYAEVEFKSIEDAVKFKFPFDECEPEEVTGSKYWTMAGYWYRTRLHPDEIHIEDTSKRQVY